MDLPVLRETICQSPADLDVAPPVSTSEVQTAMESPASIEDTPRTRDITSLIETSSFTGGAVDLSLEICNKVHAAPIVETQSFTGGTIPADSTGFILQISMDSEKYYFLLAERDPCSKEIPVQQMAQFILVTLNRSPPGKGKVNLSIMQSPLIGELVLTNLDWSPEGLMIILLLEMSLICTLQYQQCQLAKEI
jgi:hypothetical protein